MWQTDRAHYQSSCLGFEKKVVGANYCIFLLAEESPGRDSGMMTRRRSTVIQISEQQTKELSKTCINNADMSLSEKLLVESAQEKDRISEMHQINDDDNDDDDEDDDGHHRNR